MQEAAERTSAAQVARLLTERLPAETLEALLPIALPAYGGLLRFAATRLRAWDARAADAGVAQALAKTLEAPAPTPLAAPSAMIEAAASEVGLSRAHFAEALIAKERSAQSVGAPAITAFIDMLAVLGGERAIPVRAEMRRNAPLRVAASPGRAAEAPVWQNPVPLENDATGTAGLVLLWPFLQRHFADCGLLAGAGFATPDAQRRAALLLHRLGSGAAEAPETRLLLEKTLCGLGPEQPTDRAIAPTPHEADEGERLLDAVRSHWPGLSGSRNEALRETFLAREGRLVRKQAEGALTLEVSPGPYDMLVDRIPWPLSVVRLSWMREALYVQWR